jgi:hypothetical protein
MTLKLRKELCLVTPLAAEDGNFTQQVWQKTYVGPVVTVYNYPF